MKNSLEEYLIALDVNLLVLEEKSLFLKMMRMNGKRNFLEGLSHKKVIILISRLPK
jgi:hypothetical protein